MAIADNVIQTVVGWYKLQENPTEADLLRYAAECWEQSEPVYMKVSRAEFLEQVKQAVQ